MARRPQSGAPRMKTMPIQFRVTDEERSALERFARERRITISELIRTDLLTQLVSLHRANPRPKVKP